MDFASIPNIVLKTHHRSIVQDIQGDVIAALYENKVLTENEFQNIKSENDREREAHRLLELLSSKGHDGLNQFLDHMSLYYTWIAEPIKSSLIREHNTFLTRMKQVLTAGEVPQLSLRHVSRTEHVNQLKNYLKELESGHFVVVHGMTGCGKSSLVVEILNDPLVTMHYFQGFVQWIHVGRENLDVGSIQTEILNRLNNEEQFISIPLTMDYEASRKTLKNLWRNKNLTHGLLVLDDVCDHQIVKYLDFGCKILITTHDKSVMENIVDSRINYVKVNEGFEEEESLALFSKCLNVDYMSLPSHASKLHKLCKGFPLTISLIGAQLEMHKEETIKNSDRWIFYVEEFSDKKSDPFKFTRYSVNRFRNLEKAIEMCIQSLPDDLQKKFYDLSVFVIDINIKPEVLSVLWNLKKSQVQDVMLELIHKSLVVRIWNQPLNSYVYSIHDLLLTHLKNMKNSSESKELHKRLIENYRTYCKGDFAELPKNDNYIFLYFGYHLKHAEMFEEFPLWFMNLKFLESKISVTGPADLLADLQKYRKYIAVKSDYEEKIQEIEEFVKHIGSNLYQTKCDIVQLGLLEPETSFIYQESYKFAKSCGNPYFYYAIRTSQNCLPKPHISIVRDKIETAIFGNNHDEIIISTESGSIKVWNVMSNKCLYTYKGHTKRVTHLVKNKSKDKFLSASDDSTIRIWKMKSFSESDSGSETRTPSPETKQEHWQNLFNKNHYERPTDNTDCIFILKKHRGPVIFAQFSSDSRLIVSSSTDKTLIIWRLDVIDGNGGPLSFQVINQTSVVKKCYFMEMKPHDKILYLTHSTSGSAIYVGDWPYDHFSGLFYLKTRVLSFFPLPNVDGNDKVLVMTPFKVEPYSCKWDKSERFDDDQQPISKQQYKLLSISDDCLRNTINNPRYIAFSLSNCTIQICNSLTGYNYLDLNDPVYGILNLDWFSSKDDQSNWLLCAAEDKSIRLWCLKDLAQYTCTHHTVSTLQSNSEFNGVCINEILSLKTYKKLSEEQNIYCYKLKQNFDALWLDNRAVLIAAITQCGMLKIIYEGIDQWSMIDKKISTVSIVHSKQELEKTMVIVACEDKSIHALKFQSSEYLFSTLGNVEHIFACYDNGNLVIASLSKEFTRTCKTVHKTVQIHKNGEYKLTVKVINFIDCYVLHDKVFLLQNIDECLVVDVESGNLAASFNINGVLQKGNLMLDQSTLAVGNLGNSLRIFNITPDYDVNKLDEYKLPFDYQELLTMSLSNNKRFIVVGGQQKSIVLVDIVSKNTKHFTIDPSVNNIQSVTWSLDDTCLAIKEANQIIVFDIKLEKKIASVRVTADKFSVNPILDSYISINTAGKLVMFNLFKNNS